MTLNFNHLTGKQLIAMDYELIAHQLLPSAQINNLKCKMLIIFKSLLKYKAWKYKLHKDLDGSCLAIGEKVCLNLSFIFAIRQILNIDVPVDCGVASGLLDKELRQGLVEYLTEK